MTDDLLRYQIEVVNIIGAHMEEQIGLQEMNTRHRLRKYQFIEIVELLKLLQRKMKRFRLEGSRMRSLKMKNFNILFLHSGRL